MVLRALASTTLALAALQSQAPPPTSTLSPTSPFAAAAIKRPPPGPGAGTPVRLAFAWPAGMTAVIDADRSKTTLTPAGEQTSRMAIRYRMRVSPHPDGSLIEYDSFEPVGVGLNAPEQAAIGETLSSLVPSLIVNKGGSFVRVGDLSAIRTAIRQIIDTARKQAPAGSLPPNLDAMLRSLSSEEVLSRMARSDWESFVGAYVGFNGVVGEMSRFDSVEPSPILPNVNVPMRSTFGARELAPCQRGSKPDSCVVMQTRSVVAPGGMQVILRQLLEGMRGLDGVKYDRFDVTNEALTTLEPATMRPHKVVLTRTAEFTIVVPGQPRGTGSVVEKRTYRITYPAR